MHAKDPDLFDELFAPEAKEFRTATWIKQADLNRPDRKVKLRSSAAHEVFRAAQREVADEKYLTPALALLRRLAPNLRSVKAAAMAFDIAVQYGVGGFRQKLRRAYNPTWREESILKLLAERSDTHEYDHQRRHKILADESLPWTDLDKFNPGAQD